MLLREWQVAFKVDTLVRVQLTVGLGAGAEQSHVAVRRSFHFCGGSLMLGMVMQLLGEVVGVKMVIVREINLADDCTD